VPKDALSTPDELLAALEGFPSHALDIVAPLSPEQLLLPPAPGEWSAVELLAHLRCNADVWGGCIARILREERPSWRRVSPRSWKMLASYRAMRFEESFEAYRLQREALVASLQGLAPGDWERVALVNEGSRVREWSVRRYAEALASHEAVHVGQFEGIVAALQGPSG
jgi:hypothetical protein